MCDGVILCGMWSEGRDVVGCGMCGDGGCECVCVMMCGGVRC